MAPEWIFFIKPRSSFVLSYQRCPCQRHANRILFLNHAGGGLMPIDIRVEDTELLGFSDPTKEGVKKAGEDFIRHVIEESNRLESAHNAGGGPVEITKGMVANAALIQRHAIGGKKAPIGFKVLRIISTASALVVGIMVDKGRMQDTLYLVAFVIVIAVSLITTTISIMKE